MWEGIINETNSEGVAELTKALQESLTGEFNLLTPDGTGQDIVKGAVKLKSFIDR